MICQKENNSKHLPLPPRQMDETSVDWPEQNVTWLTEFWSEADPIQTCFHQILCNSE